MNYVWFSAEIKEGIPTLKEEKFDKLRYFTWQELKGGEIILSENTKNLVKAYFDNILVSANIITSKDTI